MNEVEKARILQMISEGTLTASEGSQLLAALSDPAPSRPPPAGKTAAKTAADPQDRRQTMLEIDMRRPDGSHYKFDVPSDLIPMFYQIAKVAIRESTRTAAQETWGGMKTIARRKGREVREGVKPRANPSPTAQPTVNVTSPDGQQSEARRHILQMVQNGRLTADDASRLIQQLDASSNAPAAR